MCGQDFIWVGGRDVEDVEGVNVLQGYVSPFQKSFSMEMLYFGAFSYAHRQSLSPQLALCTRV